MATIDTSLFPSATFKVDSGEAMPVTSRLNALRESQMGDIKFRQAQQEEADNMLLRQAYNAPDPVNFLAQQGRGDLVPAVKQSMYATQESESKLKTQRLDQETKTRAFINQGLAAITSDPSDEHVVSWANQAVSGGYLPPDVVNESLQQILSVPVAQRAAYIRNMGLSAEQQTEQYNKEQKLKEPTTEERTDGQYKWQVYSNPNLPNYGQEVPKSRIKMQLTPEQQARLEIERKQEERLAKAAEAKADAPTDSDPKVGKAFLSSINWKADEKGGESDDVSALIRKSTSGGLETFGAGAMRFFDKTTEGMKALSALKTRAADLTLKLLGGKLGSGVSNADREFMQQKTADIGNSSLTAEERLSAWNDLVNRMKTIAGVAPAAPMPGGAGAGAGANVANPYANLSNEQLLQQLSSPQGVR